MTISWRKDSEKLKRSKKWFLIISLILLLPLPLYILWSNNHLWQQYLGLKLPDLVSLNDLWIWYLVIISALSGLLIIVLLLILLFWPTRNKFQLIHKPTGQVKITNKAINGFINASLADLPYLQNPKVSSKLTNHHLRIRVTGDLAPGDSVKQKLVAYLKQLEDNLRQLLGVQQKPKIEIRFTNFESQTDPKKKRVY